jgi:hypothetical protein
VFAVIIVVVLMDMVVMDVLSAVVQGADSGILVEMTWCLVCSFFCA